MAGLMQFLLTTVGESVDEANVKKIQQARVNQELKDALKDIKHPDATKINNELGIKDLIEFDDKMFLSKVHGQIVNKIYEAGNFSNETVADLYAKSITALTQQVTRGGIDIVEKIAGNDMQGVAEVVSTSFKIAKDTSSYYKYETGKIYDDIKMDMLASGIMIAGYAELTKEQKDELWKNANELPPREYVELYKQEIQNNAMRADIQKNGNEEERLYTDRASETLFAQSILQLYLNSKGEKYERENFDLEDFRKFVTSSENLTPEEKESILSSKFDFSKMILELPEKDIDRLEAYNCTLTKIELLKIMRERNIKAFTEKTLSSSEIEALNEKYPGFKQYLRKVQKEFSSIKGITVEELIDNIKNTTMYFYEENVEKNPKKYTELITHTDVTIDDDNNDFVTNLIKKTKSVTYQVIKEHQKQLNTEKIAKFDNQEDNLYLKNDLIIDKKEYDISKKYIRQSSNDDIRKGISEFSDFWKELESEDIEEFSDMSKDEISDYFESTSRSPYFMAVLDTVSIEEIKKQMKTPEKFQEWIAGLDKLATPITDKEYDEAHMKKEPVLGASEPTLEDAPEIMSEFAGKPIDDISKGDDVKPEVDTKEVKAKPQMTKEEMEARRAEFEEFARRVDKKYQEIVSTKEEERVEDAIGDETRYEDVDEVIESSETGPQEQMNNNTTNGNSQFVLDGLLESMKGNAVRDDLSRAQKDITEIVRDEGKTPEELGHDENDKGKKAKDGEDGPEQ